MCIFESSSDGYTVYCPMLKLLAGQAYNLVEFFAGKAWVTRCFQISGLPAARLDINLASNLSPRASVAMDLTTDVGMAFPILTRDSFICIV